jgi:diguanylate cyclase (GGDEF)-like protein
MKFPKIGDIASTTVVSVNSNSPISSAIEKMLQSEHRSVIVVDENKFYIFGVMDVLMLQVTKISLSLPLKSIALVEVQTIDKNKNVLDTLEFLNNGVENICVLNSDKTLYGIVTHTDITSNIDPDTLMENFRLSDFIKLGRRMKWVAKDEITSKLLEEMIKSSFDNVVVVEDLKPIGILTTKDVMNLIRNKSDLELSIEHYMSSPVETINKSASIKEALAFIKEKEYKRAIVINKHGKLTGVISQKELISLTYSRWALLMKEYQIELSAINTVLESKNKEYEVMASTDSLTGLYNRYKFSELYLSTYISMIQRHNDMSLIMLDIDYFKKVNDTYGHNAGDKVLIQISHVLLRTLRNIDIICRWGGEEFIVILPTAALAQATIIANKLREQIQSVKIDTVGHVTASFGVSQVKEGEEMQDAINRADQALYRAKSDGRNCVKNELDL